MLSVTNEQIVKLTNLIQDTRNNPMLVSNCGVIRQILEILKVDADIVDKKQQKKPNRVVESMTKACLIDHDVRVWITMDEQDHIDHGYIIHTLTQLKYDTPSDLGHRIEQFPNVAAYEILDKQGNGIVVYPDWN